MRMDITSKQLAVFPKKNTSVPEDSTPEHIKSMKIAHQPTIQGCISLLNQGIVGAQQGFHPSIVF